MSNRESNQMTPYFIRVKGSYKQFDDARSLRVNTCYLVKLGSNMDEIDAQSIVSNYVGRHAGWNHRLDIYEVEVYEKDFRSPDLYFTINNATQDYMHDIDPRDVTVEMKKGIDEYVKSVKKTYSDSLKYDELKNGVDNG